MQLKLSLNNDFLSLCQENVIYLHHQLEFRYEYVVSSFLGTEPDVKQKTVGRESKKAAKSD